uniref:Uncharacterized protein n=1 Tax=Tanacetum cinerariifolium TaxID=118510 RepID=A0A6L2P695_TANCI|nr:hypothetical protein [Tanacetum cinerariifolium]
MFTMQQVQGRQGQSYDGTGYKGNAISSTRNNIGRQERVVKCYNFQGEGHMTEDLDAYDYDRDDVSNAKAILMANLSNYGSDAISEDKPCDNQNAFEIAKYFKNNDLKAQLQAKDTTICKLKEHIKSMRENDKEEKVKHDMDEIETINIELEHSLAKLLSKNERLDKEIDHLKQIYKDQFDSIKRTCVCTKEHSESLILQLNSKSGENEDLKAQIQDKVFVITSLKND